MADIHVDYSQLGDIWGQRDQWARREWAARQHWAQLRDDQRAGLSLLVIDALSRLTADISIWLPASCDMPLTNGDAKINISISILLPELAHTALAARRRQELELVTRATELMELERSLRGRPE